MEDKPLEDDFTLGDVMETKEPKLTKKTIFILVGIISFIVVVSIIIIIVATSKDSPKPEDSKEEDEKEPTELSKIAQISCTYDISTIKNAINIINDEYVKSSKFYIFINGKNIPFSKKYKFENYGENLVIFDIYENINMDLMFKDIPELVSVKMSTDNNIGITSMKSTFENCRNLKKVDIIGYNTEKLISMQKTFYNSGLTTFNYNNFDKNNIQDTSYMFAITPIESFNFTYFNSNQIKNMSHMFYRCIALYNLN
jgi:hypothetical protein